MGSILLLRLSYLFILTAHALTCAHALADQIKSRSVALISPCHEIKGSLEPQVWLQEAVFTSSCTCYSHADLEEANL